MRCHALAVCDMDYAPCCAVIGLHFGHLKSEDTIYHKTSEAKDKDNLFKQLRAKTGYELKEALEVARCAVRFNQAQHEFQRLQERIAQLEAEDAN